MKKKYNYKEENPEDNVVREPTIEYNYQTKLKGSPPLTEEELKDSMNGEEFIEHWCKCIDRLYNK